MSSLVFPKAPQGAEATEPAVRQYLKELERFIEAEIMRVDERIVASRKARGGPEYNFAAEVEAIRPTLDASAWKLPLLTIIGGVDSGALAAAAAAAPGPTEEEKDLLEKKRRIKEEKEAESALLKEQYAEAQKKAEEEQAAAAAAAAAAGSSSTSNSGGAPKKEVDAKELIYQSMLGANQKGGMLNNWGKKSMFRSFNDTYVVVNQETGISWYKSERDVRGGKPVETIPFYALSTNSRGSRFKNAAVCWPLITTEECPKANDKNKTYFGVQYTDTGSKGDLQFLVFGAASPEERDEWVFFLTKYIKLYLAPSAEFMQFEHMRVGAERPLHQQGVIDGEAPR